MSSVLRVVGLVSIALIVGLSAVGCGGPKPESVARQFYDAIEKGNAKKIADLSTEETAALVIPMAEKLSGQIANKGRIASAATAIDGDNATVTFTYQNGETEDVSLVKVNGKWKVTLSK